MTVNTSYLATYETMKTCQVVLLSMVVALVLMAGDVSGQHDFSRLVQDYYRKRAMMMHSRPVAVNWANLENSWGRRKRSVGRGENRWYDMADSWGKK